LEPRRVDAPRQPRDQGLLAEVGQDLPAVAMARDHVAEIQRVVDRTVETDLAVQRPGGSPPRKAQRLGLQRSLREGELCVDPVELELALLTHEREHALPDLCRHDVPLGQRELALALPVIEPLKDALLACWQGWPGAG